MSKRSPALVESEPVTSKYLKLEDSDSRDTYKTMNEEIHSMISLLRGGMDEPADLRAQALGMVYERAASNGYIKAAPNIGRCAELIKSDPHLEKALQNAIDTGRYVDVMSLAVSRVHHGSDQQQPRRSVDVEFQDSATSTAATRLAWSNTEYRGHHHEILLKNINAMKPGNGYAASVAIIQSSGTGKSRMVDEQANLVFTIPFSLRNPKHRSGGAYPPYDAAVWDYLCYESGFKHLHVAVERATLFFKHLFSQVSNEVQAAFPTDRNLSSGELARRWRAHLSRNDNRSWLYRRVVNKCDHDLFCNYSSVLEFPGTQFTKLLRVLTTLCDNDFAKSSGIKIMLYFDDADEFASPIPGDEKKTLYDAMWLSLDHFPSSAVFTVFLSTQSSLTLLSPIKTSSSSRQLHAYRLHAPITEMPFDCHPNFPLQPGRLKLDDLGNLCFLARFGRPLFWTMIEAGKETDMIIDSAMKVARKKLIFDDDISMGAHSEMAMLAILDVLITIDFEPRREAANKAQVDLVASHMRIAFSVPAHRLYICSGYPSEPFLAEAASRQMYHYMRKSDPQSRMISILKKNLEHGLIDTGQRGEAVMRVLLRKAYIDAIVAEQVDESSQDLEPNFSKGCSFLQFLKALFANKHHDLILRANPDNGIEEDFFEYAFKDAVVRFTHFVKAVDESVVTTEAMVPGFLRGSAFICHNHQKTIDIIIPVLLDRDDTLVESSMSALLIQVKRRKKADRKNDSIIDQEMLNFFPKVSTTEKSLRPYVTLVAELYVDVTSKSGTTFYSGHGASRTSFCTSSKAEEKHPRYSFRAYGCTDRTWKVISGFEHDDFIQALGMDDLLDDHPRRDEDSLNLVRQMLPFWYKHPTWCNEHGSTKTGQLNVASDSEEEEEAEFPVMMTEVDVEM